MKIGILTSGGDCPGLNAVIRGAVLKGSRKYGIEFVGIRDGWRGLVDADFFPLQRADVKGLSKVGGTILGTSRTNPYEGDRGGAENITKTLYGHKIDGIIAIGGEGTLAAANRLWKEGVPVVGVPKTIDNDLAATDYSFGFDTAVNIATTTTTIPRRWTGCVRPVTPISAVWSRRSWAVTSDGSPCTPEWPPVPTSSASPRFP